MPTFLARMSKWYIAQLDVIVPWRQDGISSGTLTRWQRRCFVAKEVERQTGSVQPYQGDGSDLLPQAPARAERYNRPDWTELRPPADTGLQEAWSKIISPYRASLLARLWLTFAWWRPVVLLLILATIAFLVWIVITPTP
jgi:hypothetical protein